MQGCSFRMVAALAATSAFIGACTAPTASSVGLRATASDGRGLYAGGSSWTIRATSAGRQEVVNIPTVGEVIVEDGHCRLVRSVGAGGIAIQEARPGPCVEVRGDHLCFVDGVEFVATDGGATISVAGCAERNEIFLERVEGAAVATVGPHAFFERCAPIESPTLEYVRVERIAVDNNDKPSHGLRFRYRDGFEICFLSRTTGRYSIDLGIEDPAPRQLTLSGAVDDL